MKKWQFMGVTPSIVGSMIFDEKIALFSSIKRVVKHEKMAIYGGYSLYSWTISGNTLLCARYPFFSFFNISAIKRVVKYEKMAIYGG